MDLKDEIIQRVVKERLGEPNGIYKRHIHQDLVKEMMEQYHQSKVNNVVLDAVIKCDSCGSVNLHQFSKTTDKCEDCGNVQRFL
tara:strand:+ start:62 stop:313 length:252 start_codon:yes stop_codon:yes gene_type:complete